MNLRHKILGMTLATAVMFGVAAKADTVVPLVTPNTTITLTNATGKTETGNVEFNQMGIQRGNGTKVPYSVAAFSEQTVPSPVTDTNILNSQYATVEPATGNTEPIVAAFDCDAGNGHNVPVWSLDKINNASPLAGELRTGDEYILTASGNQNWNTTFDCTVRDERSTNPITSPRSSFNPQTVIIAKVGALFNLGLPANQTIEQHFQNDGSQGYSAILYTDSTTLDTRISEMKKYTTPSDPLSQARAYVEKWLPPINYRFYLSYKEISDMAKGTSYSQSYAPVFAQTIYNAYPDQFQNVQEAQTVFLGWMDGDPSNGELCQTLKPYVWDNASSNPGMSTVFAPNCNTAFTWHAPGTDMTNIYDLTKQYLVQEVLNNPTDYDNMNINYDPGWNQ